ncbi:DUF4214 domain-containing protein [Microvirga tunisiensis]|uniref:DUF4214 domain-containing protein n=1 Tax=Pannonibacter tanglangensis TaxID=2750084 RepID=A0A7X5J919_9HYPH|nr:DUF4214 domain-containing protein [Pannonibacter sp. XCT-53]NBN78417.1 DUF4214 domain-containing protein [Pannonibacter sp. XCT-53]
MPTVYFSDSNSVLWRHESGATAPVRIGKMSSAMTDLAVAPDGTLYGIDIFALYRISTSDATTTRIALHNVPSANALVIDPLGVAYAASSVMEILYQTNLETGARTLIGKIGKNAAGDLAFHKGELLMAADTDDIYVINPATGAATLKLRTTIDDIWGMDSDGETLFAYAGNDVYALKSGATAFEKIADFEVNGVGKITGAASTGYGNNGAVQRGSNGAEAFVGTARDDYQFGLGGNDDLNGAGGNDMLNGGSGFDKAIYASNRADVVVDNKGSGKFTVSTRIEGLDTLQDIERITLNDGTLALDLDGAAGQTYRLYQAAFKRTPDQVGLAHNVKLMDQGLSIFDMANAFIASQEFRNTYGESVSNTQFISLLYQNVLNRAPDAAGLSGWLSRMDSGTTRKEVLFGFSESGENKALVGQAIEDGIWLGA